MTADILHPMDTAAAFVSRNHLDLHTMTAEDLQHCIRAILQDQDREYWQDDRETYEWEVIHGAGSNDQEPRKEWTPTDGSNDDMPF